MLHPVELAELGAAVEEQHGGEPPRLPADCYGEGVQQKLRMQFDETQFKAIVVSNSPLSVSEMLKN